MTSYDVRYFLKGKVFGGPTMPRDYRELLMWAEINFWGVVEDLRSHYLENSCGGYLNLARDLVFVVFVWHYTAQLYRQLVGYGIFGTIRVLFAKGTRKVFSTMLSLPPFKARVEAELAKTVVKVEDSVIRNDDKLLQFPEIPANGLQNVKVLQELDKLQTLKHSDWSSGRVSGAVYHGGEDLLELQSDAYHKYSIANQLHPDVFPGVRKMEAEVVSMVLKIFNAPESGCGCTSSGGTESLLLTGLAAREYGRRYKGITAPEVIAPITVHAGIEKACYYFGMKLHKVDIDPKTYKVDLRKVKRLINGNTVLLVGSAPNYPHGIIDDIEGLSKLALKYKIPLHVDACLGSFIVAFLERAKVVPKEKIPLFDFRVPGVTSISCDTHKYGFAPKGSSIIMYRNAQLRECQYYVSSDWTGGMYGSPTLAGSRPGALMVGCWATLVNIGIDGYTNSCYDIVRAMLKLRHAIDTNETLSQHLEVLGDPIASVVSFKPKHKNFTIYGLGDLLTSKGWHFATLQNPAALHFALTRLTVPIIDELIADLVQCTREVASTSKNGPDKTSDTAALYGVAGSVSTVGVADRVIVAFLDALYKT